MTVRLQRSPLGEDPDARLVRWGWLAWALMTVLLVWLAWHEGTADREAMISWAVRVPAIALWLLWPLWRGAIAFWHWTRARALADWHGAYFEFNGRQMRVLFEGDDIWIVASDVFDALGMTGSARDPQRVRQIAGRDGLVIPPGAKLPAFTERGLAAWMERRTDRVATDFNRWFEAQVAAPYRRKRLLVGGVAEPHGEARSTDSG